MAGAVFPVALATSPLWTTVRSASPATLSFVFLFLLLLCRRLWKFYLVPKLHPEEPLEYPYWIPVLGSAVSFFRDSHGTLTRARKHFGDTRRPFALNVANQLLYVLTSPADVSAAYKNTEALTFDVFVRDVMVSFGASESAVDGMWTYPSSDGTGFQASIPNPEKLCLALLVHDMHKRQLQPGPELDDLGRKFLTLISGNLVWGRISGPYVAEGEPGSKVVSLKGWCQTVLLDAATRAFFGEALLEASPDLLTDFCDFDDNSWMLMYRYPAFLAKKMNKSKQNAIKALTAYFDLPIDKRPGAAWFVTSMEAEQRALGIGSRDIATLLLMVYWVVNSNTYKLCFWIIAYLLSDAELLAAVSDETGPAVQENVDVDMSYLLERCPRLNAVYDEVLRITNSSSSVRNVVNDVAVGGLTLRKGNNVIIPYRQLHFNEAFFGPTASSFDPERFLKNPALARSPSYRPFGGGATYCPGRFIALQEVAAFIALLLHRYDVWPCKERNGKFPVLEEMKPCLGVMGPVDGDDIYLRVATKKGD